MSRQPSDMTDVAAPAAGLIGWIKVNWFLLAFIAAIVLAFVFLRTTPSDVASTDELSAILHSGQPVVLEFYTNF